MRREQRAEWHFCFSCSFICAHNRYDKSILSDINFLQIISLDIGDAAEMSAFTLLIALLNVEI